MQQLILAAIAVGVARSIGYDAFPPYRLTTTHLAFGTGFLALAVLVLAPEWRRQVARRDRFVQLVAPRSTTERSLWVGVAVTAGAGEELAYRGVLFAILAPWVGVPGAVAAAAALFALGHLAQGWRAVPAVLAFSVGFHLLVLATGTLYVAMAVHAAYDLIAGLSYGRLAERHGLPLENPAPAGTPS